MTIAAVTIPLTSLGAAKAAIFQLSVALDLALNIIEKAPGYTEGEALTAVREVIQVASALLIG